MSEKTKYTEKEFNEFKLILEDKLLSAKKELEEYQKQIRQTENSGEDGKMRSLDDGTGTLEKEYLNQQASRQVKFISHLENALVRIKNGTYGICRATGKLISKERLKAVPHATLSIEAKKAGFK